MPLNHGPVRGAGLKDDPSVRGISQTKDEMTSADGVTPASSTKAPAVTSGTSLEFWYSKKQALWLVAALLFLATLFGILTPPFQSPDEFNHLKRAYLLSRGTIVVGSVGNVTGGGIDTGLLAYMDCFRQFPFNYDTKVDRASVRACEKIHYSGKRQFSELSNTAMYFPMLYMPQAAALLIGEKKGLSVSSSYFLARLFSSCVSVALVMWALMVYPVPPAALAVFFLPMCVFQIASTSLDAPSFAIAGVLASLFSRGCRCGLSFGWGLHAVLAACVILLATSRVIYVPLSLLLIVLYIERRSVSYLVSFAAALSLSLAWVVFALLTVHGQGAFVQETSSHTIVMYYVVHPGTFLTVIARTLMDAQTVDGYWQMFVGVLGCLDTPIGSAAYAAFAMELAAVVIVSSSATSLRCLNKGHLALACGATISLLLLFLVALSAWTIHPAALVQGIQGRYFYPIVLLFLFAFWTGKLSRAATSLSFAILALIAISSVAFVIPRLLDRYYTH